MPCLPFRRALCAGLLALLAGAAVTVSPAAAAGGGSGSVAISPWEREIVRAVNWQRRAHGLRMLRDWSPLRRSADHHSRAMMRRDSFSHAAPSGGSWARRIERLTGQRPLGEVLALVPGKARVAARARAVVDLWMQSPPHRAALLDATYNRLGVAARSGAFDAQSQATVITLDLARTH